MQEVKFYLSEIKADTIQASEDHIKEIYGSQGWKVQDTHLVRPVFTDASNQQLVGFDVLIIFVREYGEKAEESHRGRPRKVAEEVAAPEPEQH